MIMMMMINTYKGMYVCMYIYIYICIHIFIFIFIFLFIYLLDLTSGGGVFLCGPYCLRLCAFVRTRERARAHPSTAVLLLRIPEISIESLDEC